MRIELLACGGGCTLVFTHVLADPSTIERTATGWSRCLDALASHLERRS